MVGSLVCVYDVVGYFRNSVITWAELLVKDPKACYRIFAVAQSKLCGYNFESW